jgi:uncharacterized membrane protein YkvA (DUF1232 family)
MTLAQVRSYFKSADVSRWRKALVLVALGYAVMPFDLIPDMIPVIGWLDDIGVVGAIAAFLVRDIRRFSLPVAPVETAPPQTVRRLE